MLTIITISHNSQQAVTQCLAPLLDSGRYPAFIIDNASTDGSADALAHRFPECELIALDNNVGYGRAANIGLAKVQTPYAMLLNPDLFATPEAIEKLLAHAQRANETAAIIAPAVKEKDFTGASPEPVHWISGSAMLFNMEHMKRIGYFDENIFLFSEENDLCRQTVDAGLEILLCHDVYMEHLKGKSSAPNPKLEYMKDWHFGWSAAYYHTKHGIASGKNDPRRMARLYRRKALFATNSKKKRKYQARGEGVRAFLAGEPAFRLDGTPQASPFLQDKSNP